MESAWVWAGKSAWKFRGYVGVESAWKVRGMWAWKVRGKFGVCGHGKFGVCGHGKFGVCGRGKYNAGTWVKGLMDRLMGDRYLFGNVECVAGRSVGNYVCGSVGWALTWLETLLES